jgi:hypothetical protein
VSLARFLSTTLIIGRRKGAVNYKNEVLIKIVGEILLNGQKTTRKEEVEEEGKESQ